MDPIDELARIMNDTNPPKPNGDLPTEPRNMDDPLDLGLGDRGLAELFGEPTDKPVAPEGLPADLDLTVDPATPPDDDLFSDLDFSTLEMPELDAPAELPAADPIDAFSSGDREPVSLSAHLTDREVEPAPEPAVYQAAADPYGSVQEDDLLAAMDAIELDEPAAPALASAGAPAPLSVAPASTTTRPAEPLAPSASASTAPDRAAGSEFSAFDELNDLDDLDGAQAAYVQPEGEGSSGPGKMIIIGLAALALLGVGGVFAYGLISGGGADSDAPQLIAAPEGEDKVEPAVAQDTQARPGDAAFSALDQETAPAESGPRVVLPSPSGNGLPLRSGEPLASSDIAPAPPGSTASRAVRTVTVRADGTVVESTAPAPLSSGDVQAPAADSRPVEVVSVSPEGVSVNPDVSEEAVVALRTAVQDAAQTAAQALSSSTNPPAPVARPTGIVAQPATQAQQVQTQQVQAQPVQVQPIVTQPATQPVTPPAAPATQSTNRVEPIQLAAPSAAPAQVAAPAPPLATAPAATTPAPAVTPASVPAGDFIVQLASLRSDAEARATFTNLQNRFGSILSGFGPNIQRADLGDRGIYHRVRVGPMDRAAADSLCRRYQSAGGDCFVQRQ